MTKITDLEAMGTVADGDVLAIVDVSDTTMAASGTNKKWTAADLATYTGVAVHLADTTAAHAASAVSFSPAGTVAATDVQAAVAEVATDAAAALTAHEADTTAVHGITDTSLLETTTGSQVKVDTHVNDTSAAHAATAVSFSPAGGIAATTVQAAIVEANTDAVATAASALSTHEADTTAVHGITDTAALVTLTGTQTLTGKTLTAPVLGGTVTGTYTLGGTPTFPATVETTTGSQAKVDTHVNDTVAAHAATAVSFTPTGTIAATTVQAAIAEVAAEVAVGGVRLTQMYTVPGPLTPGTGVTEFVVTLPGDIVNAWASVTNTFTGSSVLVDVNINGSTIFVTQANRPTIPAGSRRDTAATPDAGAFAAGDRITVDVDQVGTHAAADQLTIGVEYVYD